MGRIGRIEKWWYRIASPNPSKGGGFFLIHKNISIMSTKTFIILLLSLFLANTIIAQQEECPQFEWVEGMTVKRNDTTLLGLPKKNYIVDEEGNMYFTYYAPKPYTIPDTLFIRNITQAVPISIPIVYPNNNIYGLLILKLDANYNLLWHRFVYTSNKDIVGNHDLCKMQLDSRGNVYVTGRFYKSNVNTLDTYVVGNKYIVSNKPKSFPDYYKGDGFLFKLNGKTGDPFWIKKLEGLTPVDFQISNTDHLYMTLGAGYDTVAVGNQQYIGNQYKSSVAQFDALGDLQWITWGEQNSHIVKLTDIVMHANYLLTIDNNDNAYTFFLFDSTISKIDATGQVVWNRGYNFIKNVKVSSIHVNTSGTVHLAVAAKRNSSQQQGIDFGNGDTLDISKYGSDVLWGLETNGGQTAFASVLWDNPSDSTNILTANLKSDNIGYVYIAAHIHTRNGDTSYIGDSAIVVTLSDNNITYGSSDAFIAKVLPPTEGMGRLDHIWSLRTSGARHEVIYLSKVEDSGTEMYFFSNTSGGAIGSGDAVLGQHRFTGDSSHNYFGKINTDCSLPTEEIANPLQSVNIYPNPANTNITITNLPQNSTIYITDISGRVLNTQYNKQNSTVQIPLSGISNGMYFVQIINGENMVNRKVVVNR